MRPRPIRRTVAAVPLPALLLAVALVGAVAPAQGKAVVPGQGQDGAPAVVLPPADAPADYQLGGAYPPAPGVEAVTRDRTDAPAVGRYGICYVNGFQTQPGELGWWRRHHPRLLLRSHGRLVRDPGWPDEVLLDTRTRTHRIRIAAVLDRWAAGCARKGYQGLEPDNLDSWTRSRHLLTKADNLALAGRIVAAGHRHGLAVAQKNAAGLSAREVRRVGFDFAVAEDCEVYDECGAYRRRYGDHVIEIEYSDEGRANYRRACAARGDVWSIVYRDRDLVTPGQPGYVRAGC